MLIIYTNFQDMTHCASLKQPWNLCSISLPIFWLPGTIEASKCSTSVLHLRDRIYMSESRKPLFCLQHSCLEFRYSIGNAMGALHMTKSLFIDHPSNWFTSSAESCQNSWYASFQLRSAIAFIKESLEDLGLCVPWPFCTQKPWFRDLEIPSLTMGYE